VQDREREKRRERGEDGTIKMQVESAERELKERKGW